MEFTVLKTDCISEVLNANPIYMADKKEDLNKCLADGFCFDFTVETPAQMREIVDMYENGIKTGEFFTRGHFYNGIL